MANAVAVVPTNLCTGRLGLPSLVGRELGRGSILAQTLSRLSRVKPISAVVLVHPQDQDPQALLQGRQFEKPIHSFVDPGGLTDRYQAKRIAARKWALGAWRGGLGGATCYDELLPVQPWLEAMRHFQADAALIVGADWPLVDPGYCTQVLQLHLENPQAMQWTFTQAPPGLAGIAIGRDLLSQMADQPDATFGRLIGYNPLKPQADPIGRDVCVQVPAPVRSCTHRLVYDTPASASLIDWLVGQLKDGLATASAERIAETLAQLTPEAADGLARLPQQVTMELTTRRRVDGPVVPQHHTRIDRPDIDLDTAIGIVQQLGEDRDIVLTLGGLGDALLYEHWERVVLAAHDAGVMGVAIETDLLVDHSVLERLLAASIDVISVHLNADTAKTYAAVMGGADPAAHFAKVIDNLQWLLNERHRRARPPQSDSQAPEDSPNTALGSEGASGVPWLVPNLIKTSQTLNDVETFYDRWIHFAGHAVIRPAQAGCGLMPELSPLRMAAPKRVPCRQLMGRLSIHSDGRVARCDQDWLGQASAGHAGETPLAEIWRSMRSVRQIHEQGRWDELELCRSCHEWHRP